MCARARTSTDVGISRPVIRNDNYIYYNNTTTTSTPRTASPLVARHSRGTGGVVWKVDGEARCLPVHPSTGEYPWECLAGYQEASEEGSTTGAAVRLHVVLACTTTAAAFRPAGPSSLGPATAEQTAISH